MSSRSAHLVGIVGALALLPACEEDAGGSMVLDSVVESSDAVLAAIDADPDMWLTPAAQGTEISGSISTSGNINVTGWRSTTTFMGGAQYQSFGEKLFLSLDTYTAAGLTLSGSIVVTRHSLDYGSGEQIEDASRSTRYVGSVVANGSVSGNYVIDVHANASGATLWTCGVVNDEETGQGPCF